MNKYRKQLVDKISAWVIRAGGIGIIFCVVAVVVVVAAEAVPLFGGATGRVDKVWTREASSIDSAGRPVLTGLDAYREVYFLVTSAGRVEFRSTADGRLLEDVALEREGSTPITSAYLAPDGGHVAVSGEDGFVELFQFRFRPGFEGSERRISWSVSRKPDSL